MPNKLKLSTLQHTWIFDFDGTLVEHNGYKKYGYDVLLDGVCDTFKEIPSDDCIIIMTSREDKYKKAIHDFMQKNGLRYDVIICGVPVGERILVNDDKPGGLKTGYVICKKRDAKLAIPFECDEDI